MSSLFPAEIRDRLFNNEGDEVGKSSDAENTRNSETPSTRADPQKQRLKHYLTEEEGPSKETEPSKGNDKIVDVDTKPIADLFPNTTVMFGKYIVPINRLFLYEAKINTHKNLFLATSFVTKSRYCWFHGVVKCSGTLTSLYFA